MFWKRLASAGSCLTMSPPLKTASMYIHMFCTMSHCSTISLTVLSFTIQPVTSSLQQAGRHQSACKTAGKAQPLLAPHTFLTGLQVQHIGRRSCLNLFPPEGCTVSVAGHAAQCHLAVLKLLNQLSSVRGLHRK